MADANPVVAALIDELAGRIRDVDAVQRHVDFIRAEIEEPKYAALYAEAAAELAQARRRLADVAFDVAVRRAIQVPPEGLELLQLEDDPEVATLAAAYLEAAARFELIKRNQLVLVEALVFLVLVARAVAFAFSRVRLLPGVLVTVAAAYALAYVVSWRAVVPGHTSILWIAVLVGLPVVGDLP